MGSVPLSSSSLLNFRSYSSSIFGRPSSTFSCPHRRFRQVFFLHFSPYNFTFASWIFSFLFQKGTNTVCFLRLLLLRSKAPLISTSQLHISFPNFRIINSSLFAYTLNFDLTEFSNPSYLFIFLFIFYKCTGFPLFFIIHLLRLLWIC